MDKYKSTEKLLTPIYEMIGVDNMNFSAALEPGVDYSLSSSQADVGDTGNEQEVPNFVLGPYDNRRRPMSMYEPWFNLIEPEGYTSLPPEVPDNACTSLNFDQYSMANNKTYWEAEDADEYMTTLDESTILDIESFENIQKGMEKHEQQQFVTVTADVHHTQSRAVSTGGGDIGTDIGIYATIRKNDKKMTMTNNKIDPTEMQIMLTTNALPNIMTASCYGTLNACPIRIDQQQPNHEFIENTLHTISMTNSIIDESSSMNSSTLFEPNSLISSVEMQKDGIFIRNSSATTTSTDKNRVKWWDERSQEIEIQQIANQGKFRIYSILSFFDFYLTTIMIKRKKNNRTKIV